MILSVEHISYCKLICQCKQKKIDNYAGFKNETHPDYDCQVRYRDIFKNRQTYKYENPYKLT